MQSVVGKIRSDIARMEREMAQKQNQLQKLKDMVSAYEALTGRGEGSFSTIRRRRSGSEVKNEILNLLRNGPKRRRELLEALSEKHLLGDTEQDMNYLSSRLSTWKDIASDGKGNWQLVR